MRYKRFEDLPVWNDAIELAVQVYALTSRPEFKGHWSLKDQIERAAVSVSNNIAEGFERGTNNELTRVPVYCSRLGRANQVHALPARTYSSVSIAAERDHDALAES